MGIPPKDLLRKPHHIKDPFNVLLHRILRGNVVIQHRLGKDLKNMLPRIQRGIWILKHHLQLCADPAHLFFVQGRQISPVIKNTPAGGRLQPHKLPSDSGFPAARLAHQAKGLPLHNRKRNIIHRMDISHRMGDDTAPDRIIFLQVVNLNQRLSCFAHSDSPPLSVFCTAAVCFHSPAFSFITTHFAVCSGPNS